MKDVVTFETAQRLKAAGFPQPVPDIGQVWYVVFPEYVAFSVLNSLENMSADNEFVNNHCSFAPTATDILRELCGENIFEIKPLSFWVGYFSCGKHKHENPGEAAALAWLSVNNKEKH